jgi:hypothetical protein
MKSKSLSFLVCGTVRNVERTLQSDVNRLINAVGEQSKLDWYLVESDSVDGTVLKLDDLKSRLDGFNYLSLGRLSDVFPERIDRLIHCRNKYVEYFHNLMNKRYDYVIVMDFDGINNLLTYDSFWSCWSKDGWGVVCANQKGPYYDIWALKHKYWNPNDCFQTTSFFNNFLDEYVSSLINVSSKQIVIPSEHEWIEVESAYGGIAIYTRQAFMSGKSYSSDVHLGIVCDSVPFHKNIIKSGHKIYINPKFINADFTEHTNWLRPGINRVILKINLALLILFGVRIHRFIRGVKRLIFH